MTYAPDDLLAVQRYARDKTGQFWASLGIIHSTPQGGGYHEGEDLLIAAGTAPGPQYPGSDYSYTDSSRDLLPTGRLAGGDAASAFDLGGDFPRFLEFNAWMRTRMLTNDPRTQDIREMIHTLDGRTVRRIDRTGRQPDGGDNSHLSHTHFSFFRDSLGRRNRDDNFLGLLREFFDGATPTPAEVPDVNLGDKFEIPTWNDPDFKAPESTTVQTALAVAQRRSYQAWQAAVGARRDIAAVNLKVDALAKALVAGGGSADVASVVAHVDQGIADLKEQESATVTVLKARIDGLQAALAKADKAASDVLGQG